VKPHEIVTSRAPDGLREVVRPDRDRTDYLLEHLWILRNAGMDLIFVDENVEHIVAGRNSRKDLAADAK
jgi:hypothetical protein